MKKVLYTLQWYPSKYSANGFCDEKIINALKESGQYQITCLSYKPFGGKKYEIIDGVRVIRFTRGLWWNTYTKLKEVKNKRVLNFITKLNKLYTRISQVLTVSQFPNNCPFVYRRFANKALRLHKKEHFDIVISEFHGLDSLHAGAKIKEVCPDVVFIPVLWDAFCGKETGSHLPKQWAAERLKDAEYKEVHSADSIIAMESGREYYEKNMQSASYISKIHFLDIPGVVEKSSADKTESPYIKEGKINIVFAGVVSLSMRNPEYIINALSQSRNASGIHLMFFCMGDALGLLHKLKSASPLDIDIYGYIPQDELQKVYQNADILLNIGNAASTMVPSKIFEYVSYGKPIISTYCIDEDTSKAYLERYPLSCCIDQRKQVEESVTQITTFLSNNIGKTVSFETVEKEFRNNTPQAYVDLIADLFRRHEGEKS